MDPERKQRGPETIKLSRETDQDTGRSRTEGPGAQGSDRTQPDGAGKMKNTQQKQADMESDPQARAQVR